MHAPRLAPLRSKCSDDWQLPNYILWVYVWEDFHRRVPNTMALATYSLDYSHLFSAEVELHFEIFRQLIEQLVCHLSLFVSECVLRLPAHVFVYCQAMAHTSAP